MVCIIACITVTLLAAIIASAITWRKTRDAFDVACAGLIALIVLAFVSFAIGCIVSSQSPRTRTPVDVVSVNGVKCVIEGGVAKPIGRFRIERGDVDEMTVYWESSDPRYFIALPKYVLVVPRDADEVEF